MHWGHDPGGSILGPDSSSSSSSLSNSQSWATGFQKIPQAPANFRPPWPLDHLLVTGLRPKLMGEKCCAISENQTAKVLVIKTSVRAPGALKDSREALSKHG